MSHDVRRIQRHLHERARRQPTRPIEHVMRFITDWVVINEAWRTVRAARGANTPGADRLAVSDLAADPASVTTFLQNLADRLQSGTYVPGQVLRFEIAKPGQPGKTRPIAILTLEDRVVHAAIKIVLESMIEAHLGDRSFGFRPNRNRYDELQAVRRLLLAHPEQYGAAVSADIASCFDELDHRLVLDDVRSLVSDARVIQLCELVLEQVGNGHAGWLRRRRVGVLQGSPLSPLLANWNLARFDRAWRQRHGDRAPLFRYADDLLILAPDLASAARLRRQAANCLRQTNHLALAPAKTQIRTIDEGLPLLGLVLKRHRDPFLNRDDIQIFTDLVRFQELVAEIDRWVEELDSTRPLGVQFDQLNQRLRGWFESYQFAYDAPQAFEALDRHLFAALRRRLKLLRDCTVAALRQNHYHRLKDGRETWQSDGVPLVVLSSLPRRRYRPSETTLPWDDGRRQARERDAGFAGSRTKLGLAAPTLGQEPADPVIVALLEQAAPEPVRRDHGGDNLPPHAVTADRWDRRPSEPSAAGNGQTHPMNLATSEGPDHAS